MHILAITLKPNKHQNQIFVFGPARSGTSWLADTLSLADGALAYYKEPLFHLKSHGAKACLSKPAGSYAMQEDHTALPFQKRLAPNHWLAQAYQDLVEAGAGGDRLLRRTDQPILLRKDPQPDWVLIKEVHALLAIEAVVERFAAKTILITRDPIYAVDSLLSFRPLNAHMWRKEAHFVCEQNFLEHFGLPEEAIQAYYAEFVDDGQNRKSVIFSKVMTVALLNHMLHQIAQTHQQVKLVTYADLCAHPLEQFKAISNFCGLQMGTQMINFIRNSTKAQSASSDPYAVQRETKKQVNRPLRFITAEEATAMRSKINQLIPEPLVEQGKN